MGNKKYLITFTGKDKLWIFKDPEERVISFLMK